jgi:hypothetical protein
MPSNKHDRQLQFARLHRERPILFNLIAPCIALLLCGTVQLVEWMFR